MTRPVSVAPAFALPWRTALACSLLFVAPACTEPVDCAAQPHRCPAVGAAPVAAEPTKAEPAMSATRKGRLDRAAVEAAARRGQRLLEVPPGDPARAVLRAARLQPGQRAAAALDPAVAQAQDGDGGVPDATVRAVLGSLRDAMKARDLEAMAPKLSPRLATTLREAMPQHGDRLWRHMDRYVTVLDGGYQVTEGPGTGADTRQVVLVPTGGGRELKPIFAKTAEGWKIERF